MIKKYVTICLFLLMGTAFAECLTPDICRTMESIEVMLISDNFSKTELTEFSDNFENFISEQEQKYRELRIDNPDLDQLRSYRPLLASKIALADCGKSGEVLAGALSSDLCYPCMNREFASQGELDGLAANVNDIEEHLVADIAEEKLASSAVEQMIKLCDEGSATDIRACVEGEFGNSIPDHVQVQINRQLASRRTNAPNKNRVAATKINQFLDDLRGGDYCPEANAVVTDANGGLNISEWTLENNGFVDFELALSKCSPMKAMALIENMYFASGHQGWDFAEKEAFTESIHNLWRGQHTRAHEMLTGVISDVGSVALGGRIFDCLEQFPPPEINTHGSSLNNFSNRGQLISGNGKCEAFTADDVQAAREDAINIAAKELKDKNTERRGEKFIGIFGTNGSDERFLAQMAYDNPQVLGEMLAENLRGGSSCIGHICDAMQEAQRIERVENITTKIRRGVVTGLAVGSAILAFTPAAPGAAAMAGIAVGVSAVSVVSAAIDRAAKADQIRAMKVKLMGEQGDVTPEEWERLKGLEKELDALTMELALEIGMGVMDVVQFIRLARNMDEAVDLLRRLKGSSKSQIDDFAATCLRH